MVFELLLIALVFLAVMLVSGNNLSACVGPAVGARILSKRAGAFLGVVGFTTGLLLQGWGMINSINSLIPNATMQLQSEVLMAAIVVFVVAHLVRVPLSLSMSLVGLLVGAALAHNLGLQASYVFSVVALWFIAPIAAAIVAFYLIRVISRQKVRNIWRRIRFYKVLLLILAFTSAYTTGANTIGLIVATAGFNITTVLVAVSAVFIGVFCLGEGAIRRVGEEFYLMRYSNATVALAASTILVEVASFLNIPLSNTQATTAAVFGAGISYKSKFLSLKPYLIILGGWIVAPLLSFSIGYFLISI
ncbi:MAG: inorganic phosphate transporter [Crenarchaeota archaeon]|nr:inorganic phosphate transporter [Thermoproteota archaeon]